MKKCKFCAEEIQDEAIICKHCKSNVADNKTETSITPPSNQSVEGFLAKGKEANIKEPKKLTWLWWTLGIIIFLMLIRAHYNNPSKELGIKSVSNPSYGRKFNKIHAMLGDFTSNSMRINRGIVFGDRPEEDALYHLGGMEIMQKVQDGFLIKLRPEYYDEYFTRNDIMFLYDDSNRGFSYRTPVDSLYAYYVGTYEYQTMTGFSKQIYAFRIFDDNDPINKKIIEEIKNNNHSEHFKEQNIHYSTVDKVPEPVLTDEEREKRYKEAREHEGAYERLSRTDEEREKRYKEAREKEYESLRKPY